MKYKVIKSFPWYNEGDIYDTSKQTLSFNPADYPEYFQLIEENKTVWDLESGDTYVLLNNYWDIKKTFWWNTDDIKIRDFWNCFLNQEEAEREREKTLLITKLLRSKHEMGLNKEFVREEKNYSIWKDKNILYMWFPINDFMPLLWYFSKESQEYVDNNETDLKRLFELTK